MPSPPSQPGMPDTCESLHAAGKGMHGRQWISALPEMMDGNMSITCSPLQPQAKQQAESRPDGVMRCAYASVTEMDLEGMAPQGRAHLLTTRDVEEKHCCYVCSARNKLANRAFVSEQLSAW